MKGQIWRKWASRTPVKPPQLRWSDILWTILPLLLWLGAIYSRGVIIRPHCAEHPEHCTRDSLWQLDMPAIGLEAGQADGLSFTTQGLAGVLAMSVPPLWHLGTVVLGSATPVGAMIAVGVDLVVFTQTTAINGLFTETAHLISQRPRPFVYMDPVRARDYSNYTSFYSGHTSFAAASMTGLTLTLAGRGAPPVLVLAGAAATYALVSLTGLYRVLAGRHFPTDVLCAALAGIVVAFAVAYRVRRSRASVT